MDPKIGFPSQCLTGGGIHIFVHALRGVLESKDLLACVTLNLISDLGESTFASEIRNILAVSYIPDPIFE